MATVKNIWGILNKIFGPILLVALFYNIYIQISNQPQLEQAFKQIVTFSIVKIAILVFVVFLMLFSFVIEAIKWKTLVQLYQPISIFTACKNIFTGQAFAFTSINDLGDFVGRVAHFKQNKVKLGALSVLTTYSQVLVILCIGLLGWIYHHNAVVAIINLSEFFGWLLFFVIAFGFLVLLLLYYNLKILVPILIKVKWLQWIFKSLQLVYEVDAFVLTKLLLYSLFKYVVYTVQYLLVLQLFGVSNGLLSQMSLVSLLLLGLTIIPSIAFAELGIRGKLALILFGLVSSNQLSILIATIVIWFINRVLPAIIGSFYVSTVKLKH